MKTIRLAALLLTLAIGIGSSLGSAEAHPSMFSDLSIEQAQSLAAKEGKLVVVDFTASWCGPCHKMDETTWTSPDVEKWIKENAIAVQIDVDAYKDTSTLFKVNAMPTIIIFQPKETKEFERDLGYKDPATLIAWFTRARAHKTQAEALEEEFKNAEGKGGQEEVDIRYKLAQKAAISGDDAFAATQYVWLWKNIKKEFPPMVGVRSSFMARNMQSLASHSAIAKKQFMQLRDETPADNRDDWMVLNKVVGEQNKTLEWFDSIKNDASKKAELDHLSRPFKLFLIEQGRLADVGKLCKAPLAEMNQDYKMSEAIKKMSNGVDLFPAQAASLYSCLLAADRLKEAEAVKQESLKLSDSPVLNAMFAKADEQMKQSQKPH